MSDDTGTPDSDPDHLDPAGDVAYLLEETNHEIQLADDQDPEQLREFIDIVENSDEWGFASEMALQRSLSVAPGSFFLPI